MNKIENFNILVEKAMQSEHYTHMRPVIEKELLHYDILFSLEKHLRRCSRMRTGSCWSKSKT